ncbi:MAG: dynamin family protein [Anaerolineae bacterium]
MLRTILNRKQNQILRDEKDALERLQQVLVDVEIPAEDQKILQKSIRQLDELFLLVVVGEFNSGKSAFINALLGERLLPEGVTPTTARICLVRYGEVPGQEEYEDGALALTYPADFLREINLVDTPGTNAIIRRHEQLTEEFIPRSDLVIFVTSADRPFAESERAFMERIREWGKKIVILLNKIDLLQETEIEQVIQFIGHNALGLLGFMPEVFPISARLALRAKQAETPGERSALWAASRFEAVETYILGNLDEKSRVQLKLLNPVGVGERLTARYLELARERLALLTDDLRAIDNIEGQLQVYSDDMERDFRYRMADIEKILLAMNNRGMAYFEETVRLARLFDLVNTHRIQGEFERQVVADTPQQIEREVNALIDWLIGEDLRQWQMTLESLDRHRAKLPRTEWILGPVEGGFDRKRQALLDSVGRAAQQVVMSYDREAEARQLAQSVRDAVASVALLEVSAVGLGTLLIALLHTAMADFTGLLAAGTLAVVGLLIIPARRKRAKNDLQNKLENLRQRLIEAMGQEFERELGRSLQRLREAIAPYTRFVRAEHQRLVRVESELMELDATWKQLRTRIESS